MVAQELIDDQADLLHTYRTRLRTQLRQLAIHGSANAPSGLLFDVEECRHNIRKIKSTLRGWNVDVEDLPHDSSEVLKENDTSLSSRTRKTNTSTKQKSELLLQLEHGTNLPSLGDVFVCKVIDMDDTLVLVEIPGFDPILVPGVIKSENMVVSSGFRGKQVY